MEGVTGITHRRDEISKLVNFLCPLPLLILLSCFRRTNRFDSFAFEFSRNPRLHILIQNLLLIISIIINSIALDWNGKAEAASHPLRFYEFSNEPTAIRLNICNRGRICVKLNPELNVHSWLNIFCVFHGTGSGPVRSFVCPGGWNWNVAERKKEGRKWLVR